MASHNYNKLLASLLTAAVVLQASLPWTTGWKLNGWAQPMTTVLMTNTLEGQEILQVHCKDAGSDFGIWPVVYGETYEIKFHAVGYATDYYCGFVFNGALHWFDIYLGRRDILGCGLKKMCQWIIKEAGPCSIDHPAKCYPWNRYVPIT